MKSEKWLKKWDDFRHQKNKYLEKASKIIKRKCLVKRLLGLIYISKIFKALTINFKIWHQKNIRKFNNFFLAIKFKIRYKNRFQKNFGKDFKIRLQKYIQRGLVFNKILFDKTG